MKNFKVTASHVSPRFCFTDEIVRVKPSPGRDGFWYATGELGCSKDYSSPERAARSMFEDNACTNIRVVAVD